MTKIDIEEKLLDKNKNPSRLKKKSNIDFLNFLKESYPDIQDDNTVIYLAYTNSQKKYCLVCNKPLKITNFKRGYLSNWCSQECRNNDKTYIEYFKTKLNVFDRQTARTKREQTNLEKYGCSYQMQREEVKKIVSFKNKNNINTIHNSRKTWLEKYGTVTPQNLHIPKESLIILESKDELEKMYAAYSSETIAEKLQCSPSTVLNYFRKHGIKIDNSSKFNKEVIEFVSKNTNDFIKENDRKILEGKEIDVLIPSMNFGIECHGLYWHSLNSDELHEKKYHLQKHLLATQKGIKLIQIFEDEWKNRRNACENIIMSCLGVNQKIHARKCRMELIDSGMAYEFFKSNHIAGEIYCSTNIGLYYDDVLVMVAGFSRSRYQNDKNKYSELIRLCSLKGFTVVGGASRIIKFFKTINQTSLISYSDNRIGNGNVYQQCGFSFVKNINPGYWWVKNDKRYSRHMFTKKKLESLGFDTKNKTEIQIMFDNGFKILYDAGHRKWLLEG